MNRNKLIPVTLDFLDDIERVLGDACLELEIEGETREVWHKLQAMLEPHYTDTTSETELKSEPGDEK